ncbi:tRNA uridine-5-carboxymethylaminomethyl(34) synthesis GTPase MnmE [Candidatus Omnitrophota bacterium]
MKDTIAAIATPAGESGIGIVRASGKKSLAIADKIFFAKENKKPSTFKAYSTHYGWIKKSQGDQIIDEVILTVMRAPRSYTKEDVVEINCHGGIVALRAVLDLVLDKGARLACPGEFTRRAFLNGRIDLAQAEAVLDIIRAKTDSALRIGTQQLRGALSGKVNKFRKGLLDVLSRLEANIDFPEEEIGSLDLRSVLRKLDRIKKELGAMLEDSKFGMILREGVHAVICGRANVGKSSLLNALLREERSIVTHIPGTTRDTVEEIIDIKGIPIRIVDTAGMLEPRDLIEKKALKRTKKFLAAADLAILLFDGSQGLNKEDELLIKKLKKRTTLAVINKIDLRQKIKREKVEEQLGEVVDISAKRLKNIDRLEEAIAGLVYSGRLKGGESFVVNNLRHIRALKRVHKSVEEARISLDNGLSLEFISQDIKDALSYLDDILGKRFSGDLLDKIFNDFCIGK